jgi:hypothetical protein
MGGYIKRDFQGGRCVGMGWIELVQDMNRWRALVNVNFLSICKPVSFSKRTLLHEMDY